MQNMRFFCCSVYLFVIPKLAKSVADVPFLIFLAFAILWPRSRGKYIAKQVTSYNLSMSIMLTIFDFSIKKRVNGSLCFELLPQQMSQSKMHYMDLCQHANKYKQVVSETIS